MTQPAEGSPLDIALEQILAVPTQTTLEKLAKLVRFAASEQIGSYMKGDYIPEDAANTVYVQQCLIPRYSDGDKGKTEFVRYALLDTIEPESPIPSRRYELWYRPDFSFKPDVFYELRTDTGDLVTEMDAQRLLMPIGDSDSDDMVA